MAKRKLGYDEMLELIQGKAASALPGPQPSAIDLLADLSYKDARDLAKTLYLRQLDLQRTLRNMAQHYHDAHCGHTMKEFADCYKAVCTRNRKLLADEIVPRAGELPGD